MAAKLLNVREMPLRMVLIANNIEYLRDMAASARRAEDFVLERQFKAELADRLDVVAKAKGEVPKETRATALSLAAHYRRESMTEDPPLDRDLACGR